MRLLPAISRSLYRVNGQLRKRLTTQPRHLTKAAQSGVHTRERRTTARSANCWGARAAYGANGVSQLCAAIAPVCPLGLQSGTKASPEPCAARMAPLLWGWRLRTADAPGWAVALHALAIPATSSIRGPRRVTITDGVEIDSA